MKIRVFQLARELKVQPEALVTVISSLGVDVKNPMSALDDELVEQVRRKMAAERAGTRRDVVKKDVRRAAAGATSTASTSTSASTTASVSAPASTPPPPRTTTTTVTTETVRHTPPPAPTPKPAPASKVTSKPKSPSAKPTGAPASAPPAASQPAVPPAATDASTVRREGYSPGRAPQDTGSAPLGPSRTPHIGSANAGRPSASGFRQTALGSRPGQKRKKKKGRQVDEQAVRASVRRTLATLDSGRSKRRRRRGSGEENEELAAQPLKVHEFATVAELASLMEVRPTEVIAKCLQLGILANINRRLEKDEIAAIMDEFGHEAEFVTEYGVERIQEEEELDEVSDAPLAPRAPIVTVMGHVDHGKTTLLDHIRKTRVTEQESGGITQHIGAYRVETSGGTICFLDTPGHEAFTAMRARGARITDEVVLVVAANDEVRPQTIEAINHAKAAGVPLVVAINKIDVNGANPDNIRKGLSDAGVLVESWGGKTVDVEISAKKGMNVEKLLEMIVLEAELLDLKAQPGRTARGAVIEARRDAGRGIVATVLVQDGTLHIGDSFVCGSQFGRVRAMSDERGARLEEAGPSTPVEVLGWSGVPQAGDSLTVMKNDARAREIAAHRGQIARAHEHRLSRQRTSLVSIHERIQAGELQELNVIIKADVGGSVEALRDKLESLSTSEVKVQVIHSGVGLINESDVQLAMASKAIIVGFHTRADARAHQLALSEDVEIRLYRVIYDVEQEIKDAMSGLLSPEKVEKPSGSAEVRQVFDITKVGTIAGCMVVSGKIHRTDRARVYRGVEVVHDGSISSLKRVKDDVREVATGFECGIGIENFEDLKEGDVIEAYTVAEVARRID